MPSKKWPRSTPERVGAIGSGRYRAGPVGTRGSTGRVIVFNCFSEAMELFSVGGASGGAIAAWNTGTGVLFTPAGLAVPRSIDPIAGHFCDGANHAIIDWAGEIFYFDVAIDSNRTPPDEDLALFVQRTQFALLDGYGVPLASGPLKAGPAIARTRLK